MTFRDRLIATVAAARAVIEVPGVLIVGSEVPNRGELAEAYARLRPELRHVVRSNLTLLSLLGPRPGMPEPGPRRAEVNALLHRLEPTDRS